MALNEMHAEAVAGVVDRVVARYRRDPSSSDEFAAVKKDDHLLDALRYVCLGRAWNAPGDDPEPSDRKPWTPGTAPSAEWLEGANDQTGALI